MRLTTALLCAWILWRDPPMPNRTHEPYVPVGSYATLSDCQNHKMPRQKGPIRATDPIEKRFSMILYYTCCPADVIPTTPKED